MTASSNLKQSVHESPRKPQNHKHHRPLICGPKFKRVRQCVLLRLILVARKGYRINLHNLRYSGAVSSQALLILVGSPY